MSTSFSTPSYPFQGRVGPQSAPDGSYQPFKVARDGSIATSGIHGKYYEAVRAGRVFSLRVGPTSTGIAAGHITGASAAAACQIAVLNPAGSGINISILKFGLGIVSGTWPAGPVLHGYSLGATLAASVGTGALLPKNCLNGSPITTSAITIGVLASSGSALTGGLAVVDGQIANFAATATAQAVPGVVSAVEDTDGSVVLAPGATWLPVFTSAGTSVLSWMSVVYEEIPA